MKKILFLCYYSGFNHTEHILYKKIFSDSKKYTVYTIKYHSEIRKEKLDLYDFIFCGCFTLNKNIMNSAVETIINNASSCSSAVDINNSCNSIFKFIVSFVLSVLSIGFEKSIFLSIII